MIVTEERKKSKSCRSGCSKRGVAKKDESGVYCWSLRLTEMLNRSLRLAELLNRSLRLAELLDRSLRLAVLSK